MRRVTLLLAIALLAALLWAGAASASVDSPAPPAATTAPADAEEVHGHEPSDIEQAVLAVILGTLGAGVVAAGGWTLFQAFFGGPRRPDA
jgi:hypothetical protein